MVCYDVGANVGFYTLLLSRLVGPHGSVVAFEPLPSNVLALRRHIELNHCTNVVVKAIALSNHDGEARFAESPSNSMGRLSEDGALVVSCQRLDTIVSGGCPPPDVLKIDVEGEEAKVLEGAQEILQTARPIVFLATHGPSQHVASIALLKGNGYHIEGLAGEPIDSTDELIATQSKPPFPG
jgi:FkbM family methyltransferase